MGLPDQIKTILLHSVCETDANISMATEKISELIQRDTFTKEELELIKSSLQYTKEKYGTYFGYPSKEFQQEQVKNVEELLKKVRVHLSSYR